MNYFLKRIALIALMALIAFFIGAIVGAKQAKASDRSDLVAMAHRSHLYVSNEVLSSIIKASHRYQVPAKELFTLAIVESNLNPNAFRLNTNGTRDVGLLQINTINANRCLEYNINTVLGNTMCAAKLIASLRTTHPNDYLGVYHSKTVRFKRQYLVRVNRVLYSLNN